MVHRKKVIGYTCGGLLLLTFLGACARRGAPPQEAVRPTPPETTISQPASPPDVISGNSVRFGVLSIDSATSVSERYSPLMDYLGETVGRPFELVPVSQEGQFAAVSAGELDFIAHNPLAAVQIQRLYQTTFLVTHHRPQTGAEFSGLIVVRQDSTIQTLDDLQGKRVACVAFQTAAAGCTFQIFHLLEHGIDPFTDFERFVENKSQDNIVLAVLNGTIDAGFIRTGQLEKMVNKALISSVEEVRILDPKNDGFPFVHTTERYPEWPIAALEGTEMDLVEAVEAALLNIPDEHPALVSLKADGFIPAVDYTKIDNLIQALKLRSWDIAPPQSGPE